MRRLARWLVWTIRGAGAFLVLAVAAAIIWRNDIAQALLAPEQPFLVYRPPPKPDYRQAAAWALLPTASKRLDPPAEVFFVHPTTFDGGRDWNGPIHDRTALAILDRVMLPNWAGPFESSGRVFAPFYRQASLYTALTMFDDAVEAREFAYGDVRDAFEAFLTRARPTAPVIIVGVEQGGQMVERLVREDVAPRPERLARVAAVYMLETATPRARWPRTAPLAPCSTRDQTGCLVAWISAPNLDFGRSQRILNRSLTWNDKGKLVSLDRRTPVCFNPLLGRESEEDAPARLNRGAANASGLEWGTRPGFLARQVGARCENGILRLSTPRSSLLRRRGGWTERLRVPGYNLFWADLEADAQQRVSAWLRLTPRA